MNDAVSLFPSTLPLDVDQTKITDIGGGSSTIESFFDVFTEVDLMGQGTAAGRASQRSTRSAKSGDFRNKSAK